MNTLRFESYLANKFRYKKLSKLYSDKCRNIFFNNVPNKLKPFIESGNHNMKLYNSNRSLITTGFNRIVIGDYGAFIEFTDSQANIDTFICKPGQEYRFDDPKYSSNIKYLWYTSNDTSGIKIYYQVRRVSYADYLPGMYYISVHEVI